MNTTVTFQYQVQSYDGVIWFRLNDFNSIEDAKEFGIGYVKKFPGSVLRVMEIKTTVTMSEIWIKD